MAAAIHTTKESAEAIKGGESSLTGLLSQQNQYRGSLLALLGDPGVDHLCKHTASSLLLQSLSASEAVKDLIKKEVASDRDFDWRVKPKFLLTSTAAAAASTSGRHSSSINAGGGTGGTLTAPADVLVDVLDVRRRYAYEYLGDGAQSMASLDIGGGDRTLLTLFAAIAVKQFPLLRGDGPKCAAVEAATAMTGCVLYKRTAGAQFASEVLRKVRR